MNRRSLLQALGLAAVAPVLPNIPVAAAKPLPNPAAVLAEQFKDPLYAIAFTEGSNGERYRHHMPATMHYAEHKGRPWADDLVIDFTSIFNGTVRSVEIANGDKTLVTLYREAFDSPHWTTGMSVRVTIGIDTNPTENA